MIDIVKNKIEELKHYDYNTLGNYQKAKLPSVGELKVEKIEKLNFHGAIYSQYKSGCLLYIVHNLPYINRRTHAFATTINKLVDREELCPILIFADGKLVKWSNITIISDCKYSYIFIENMDRSKKNKLTFISFPFKIKYAEDVIDKTNTSLFKFNSEGKCISKISGRCTTVDIPPIHTNIVYDTKEMRLNELQKYPDVTHQLCDDNFIIFRNGLLSMDYSIDYKGLNIFQVNKGNLEINSRYYIFYYYDDNLSLNYLYHDIPNKQYTSKELLKEKPNKQVTKFNKDFKFSYDRNLSYETNLSNALEYIMKYNSTLIDDIYKSLSTIISKVYSGKQIRLKSVNRYCTLTRYIDNECCEIMIFVNGKIASEYRYITYDNINFTFPIMNIEDNDRVEILYFKNVNNNNYRIKLDDKNQVSSDIIDTMIMFTKNPEYREFDCDNTNIEYEIELSNISKNDDGTISIIPKSSSYYGEYCNIASERQFRYDYVIVNNQQVSVTLNHDKFKYTKRLNQFLVFRNGLKVDKDQYIITIPNINNPYTNVSVYFNKELNKGDLIEVFYIPEPLEEFVSKKSFYSPYTVLDRSKLNYSFSKDTCFVFSNGKKVLPQNIINLSSSKIGIKNLTSNKNLSFMRYIKPIDILNKLYKENISKYDQLVSELDHDTIVTLFENIPDIKNAEANNRNGSMDMRYVVYEIINDYFINCRNIHNVDEFIYEIDDYFEKNEDGYIIPFFDANLEDKLK